MDTPLGLGHGELNTMNMQRMLIFALKIPFLARMDANSVHFTHNISGISTIGLTRSRAGAPAARGLEGTPLATMALAQRSNGDRWGRLLSPRTPQQGGKPAWEATETADLALR